MTKGLRSCCDLAALFFDYFSIYYFIYYFCVVLTFKIKKYEKAIFVFSCDCLRFSVV